MIILFEGKLDILLYAWNDDKVISWVTDIEKNAVSIEDNLMFPDKYFAHCVQDIQKEYDEIKKNCYIDKINEITFLFCC